ncbi:hypothetical protein GKQ38_02390 [Candidatus Nanohaloarchaea archaeon]|nr:hypothetical protein GKQ38_02390 [Candidatus Nanohaloarchaea archaeon]
MNKKFLKAVLAFVAVNLTGIGAAAFIARHDIGAALLTLAVFLIGGPALVFDRFFTQ